MFVVYVYGVFIYFISVVVFLWIVLFLGGIYSFLLGCRVFLVKKEIILLGFMFCGYRVVVVEFIYRVIYYVEFLLFFILVY